jgi:adenylosuccinate lyase
MLLNELSAVSPIDGRYRKSTQSLSQYFSEAGLIQYRVKVEVEYLIALSHVALRGSDFGMLMDKSVELRNWAKQLTIEEIQSVKEIEKTTNHDVKAVEYFVKSKLEDLGLNYYKEWVHFGLTSQDINNTSIPWSMKNAIENEVLPKLISIVDILKTQAKSWAKQPMLAKTHGQPASPTTLGKEWWVFVSRLESQIESLKNIPYTAKFGGATGNFNAHQVAYPEINWIEFANNFVNEQLGLTRVQFTTQIEPYDFMAAHLDNWKRINNILIDFSRDVWTYISMDYFKQKIKEGEVGSSAMPHKVNPIDFENAEGNFGIANALVEHLASKLPISRLQRDLTDSTVLRNLGVPFGHILIALNSLDRGLGKLILNAKAIDADLENNWAVIAEAIQTILRRERYPNPYEALKELTRSNEKITREKIHNFIDSLDIADEIKNELKQISPQTYTGVSAEFC